MPLKMASSCCNKRRPQHHRHDHGEDHHYDRQHGRGNSNRFTSISSRRMMHFHNNTQTLAALVMFLAVLLMSHHQVVSEETTAPEPANTIELQHPAFQPTKTPTTEVWNNAAEGTEDLQVLSGLTPDIQQTDINNDIFSAMVEVSPEIKMAPEFIDSQSGKKALESTDNLEQSIRNSVKTEIDSTDDDSSPVMEILKDITEPDIRQTLTEDLIEPTAIEKDTEEETLKVEIIEDQSQQVPVIPIEVIDESEVPKTQLDGSSAENDIANNHNLEIKLSNETQNKTLASLPTESNVSEKFEALSDTSNAEKENAREARNLEIEMSNETSESSSLSPSELKSTDVNETQLDGSNAENENTRESRNIEIETVNETSESSSSSSSESNSSETIETQSDGSNAENENPREARNIEIETLNESKNETSDSSSSSSSESNSSEILDEAHNKSKIIVSGEEENETEVEDEPQKPSKETESATKDINNPDKEEKQEQHEADLTIPETSGELNAAAVATTPSTDIAILGTNDHVESFPDEEEALSVVLDESLSSTVPTNEEDTLTNVDQREEQTSLDIIAAEEEEATIIPEESEHIVIKKVLDAQEIFVDETATTNVPFPTGDLGVEIQSVVFVEEPTPTIVEEDVPVPERELLETVQHPVENFNQKSQDVIPQKVVEEHENVVTNDNVDIIKEHNKDLVNEKELHIKPIVDESDTLNSESTYIEGGNIHGSISPESKSDKAEREPTEDELEHSPSGDINDEAIIIRNKEERVNVEGIEPQYHEHITPQIISSSTESAYELSPESRKNRFEETFVDMHVVSTTAAASDLEPISENDDISVEIANEDMDYTKTAKGSRSVNKAIIDDDSVATMFVGYPPQDAGQTFNGNLADESSGIGKALPVSTNDGSNRSTIIIILSSGTAFLFIVISVTIFLISFQRQHGTLDIEMQERSCGKDNLDEEDAETFAKLLEVELPPSVAIALEETEECL